ncbi:MAG: metal ABC transporter substrate-binding protein [Clostridiales bacterium]|nr:metal ABC transporter substrate-binding protein [Clostridiales bacterium]
MSRNPENSENKEKIKFRFNKYIFTVIFLCVILAASVGIAGGFTKAAQADEGEAEFNVVASFYPVYIIAENVIGDADGVALSCLSEPQTGCLHDFQLTPQDIIKLGGADIFLINGGGIESFMEEVADTYPDLATAHICDEADLICDDGGDENAHAWMSVKCYRDMVQTTAQALSEADPANATQYEKNADIYDEKLAALEEQQESLRELCEGTKVILFHEAYEYVAADYGMDVCRVMDLDEERQVSAGEVADVLEAVDDGATLILAEEQYGEKMARTVQQEADVTVVFLDPLNRGDYDADSYIDGMEKNIRLLEKSLEAW